MRTTSTTFALIIGAVFLAAGIIGFFDNPLIGATGYFATDNLLNSLYVITGVIGLGLGISFMAKTEIQEKAEHDYPSWYLSIVGVLYVVFSFIGFAATEPGTSTTLLGMSMNHVTNWLHLILGAASLAAGVATAPKHIMRTGHGHA